MSEIRVTDIKGEDGSAAVNFSKGINASGIVTATTFVGNLTGNPTGSGANLTNIPAGNLTGTVADARIATLTASKLTGALPAISGANLTNVSAGKVLQVVQEHDSSFPRLQTNSTTFTSSSFKVTITPTAANSKILVDFRYISNNNGVGYDCYMTIRRSIAGGSFVDDFIPNGSQSNTNDNRYLTRNYGQSSRNEISTSMQILDTPSYSLGQAIEYKMYARSGNASNYIEIPSSPNRTPVLCFATEIAA